ncbi:MAG TPA: hypothetical protein PKJ19_11005 [Flavobacteriales bacterium]|nr:hypothetical protein [Flavobacteriales bacterium]
MSSVPLLTSKAFGLTVDRLCYQLIEDHGDPGGERVLGIGQLNPGMYTLVMSSGARLKFLVP